MRKFQYSANFNSRNDVNVFWLSASALVVSVLPGYRNMPRPFELIDSVRTNEGLLELRKRGDSDFMISVGGRVLMTSNITTSELALAREGCRPIADTPKPRVLIGGLGLGFTLRAALDILPHNAKVTVSELHKCVVDWCCGPAAVAAENAALDRRTTLIVSDVAKEIRRVAEDPKAPRYDAILWDLYVGPKPRGENYDPLYGDSSVARTCAALRTGGVFAVWGEKPSPAFEERLRRHGFSAELVRTDGNGHRHAVFLAVKRPERGRKPAQKGSPSRR